MDSADCKQEEQTQIQCFQGLQRRKPEPKRDYHKTNSAAKSSQDQKRKSVYQEQSSSSRQGSAEQKKTAKNPIANRECKEDKYLVSHQNQIPAKIQPTNVKSARSIASPPDQRDTSTRRFLTSRQQGSLYNNFIESTSKTNLTSSQSQNSQLQGSSSRIAHQQQSQLSINQKKKKQLNIIAQHKHETSPNKVSSVSNLKSPSVLVGFQPKNPPASPQNSENQKNENPQELSEVLQNVNFSSVLQNVNISEIVGVDQSSSQRSMIQRKHSMSSLIRPNSSSSLSISGWQGPMNLKGIQNDNVEEKYDPVKNNNNTQTNPKSTRQKSQLDLLILANPRKTEPLIQPNSQFSSQQKKQLFKQYQSPKRDIIKDATKEAALKQQEALRKWKQYARPDQFEMESSLIGQKEEINNKSLAIKETLVTGSQRKSSSNSPQNQKKTAIKKQQAKIFENMQFQHAESRFKQNVSDGIEKDKAKIIHSADAKQENFCKQPSNSPNQGNSFKIPDNIKKCQDAQKNLENSSLKDDNDLPKIKDSSKERNVQASYDDIQGSQSGNNQDIEFIEKDNSNDVVEPKGNETNQMQNLRESLKISITSASLHKNSETLGGSLSPGISSNLYQIQEKDSQQNTQRQHFPEQHFLTGVDWKGLNVLKDEFFTSMRHNPIKCPIHADIISLYCEKDKSLLCVSCLFDTEEHQKHTVVPLKAASANILANSNLLKAQLKEKVNSFDAGLKKCSANRQQIERSFEKNLDALNKEFQALKSSINQTQKAMEQQIISSYEAALFKYDTLIADIKEIEAITSESSNNAIPVTASSPLEMIAKEHFVFSALVQTLQHASFSVTDIKKTDLDIFTVKQVWLEKSDMLMIN